MRACSRRNPSASSTVRQDPSERYSSIYAYGTWCGYDSPFWAFGVLVLDDLLEKSGIDFW